MHEHPASGQCLGAIFLSQLLAFESLSKNDLNFVLDAYPSFRAKIEYAMTCTDFEGPFMSKSLRKALQASGFDCQANNEHLQIVRGLRNAVDACHSGQAGDLMLRAAPLRGFLG